MGDQIEFGTNGKVYTGTIYIINDHDISYDVWSTLDGEEILVKHLPKSVIRTDNLVNYQWSANGEVEVCRKDTDWIKEGICHHYGQPLSGNCIRLINIQNQDVYHLHRECCQNSVSPLK